MKKEIYIKKIKIKINTRNMVRWYCTYLVQRSYTLISVCKLQLLSGKSRYISLCLCVSVFFHILFQFSFPEAVCVPRKCSAWGILRRFQLYCQIDLRFTFIATDLDFYTSSAFHGELHACVSAPHMHLSITPLHFKRTQLKYCKLIGG